MWLMMHIIQIRKKVLLGGEIKMPVCSFCRGGYEFPRGTTVVQKSGDVSIILYSEIFFSD